MQMRMPTTGSAMDWRGGAVSPLRRWTGGHRQNAGGLGPTQPHQKGPNRSGANAGCLAVSARVWSATPHRKR